MTTIDIISGFLGAGKTTLIKKLLEESFKGQKLVLIENEFGEIGIDGGFLKDSGIQINEMNSGCICCSLVGDFNQALHDVVEQYAPDRVIIEPSGVGKLSDVSRAVGNANKTTPMVLGSAVAVVNAKKCKMYMKNFGEFFNDQIETAGTIILSRTQDISESKLEEVIALIREHNKDAVIITTPWDQLSGDTILSAMAHHSLAEQLMAEAKASDFDDDDECDDPDCECHHHHHHDDDEECECHHHHHHDDEDEHDHDHECCHHHDHDEDEHEHEHHHHHDHDEHDHDHECCCHHDHDEHDHDHEHHHHHHHHHHGHDADEVFVSWGEETPKKYTKAQIEEILEELDTGIHGAVLRAKGYVPNAEGESWIHFDMVPGEIEIRDGAADYTGRICVIGSGLKENELPTLFGLK